MLEDFVLPELKQVLGSMIFAAGRPLDIAEMKKVIKDVADSDQAYESFKGITDENIQDALAVLSEDLKSAKLGFHVSEVGGGYRFQSDVTCGKWIKKLLDIGKPSKLSRPALETLAIIAYRQPVTKSQIEGIRGVNADHIIRNLLELRLIKIMGRSELPGKPFTYGTTQQFLEYFGLKSIKDLHDMEPLLAMSDLGQKNKQTQMDLGDKDEESSDALDSAAENNKKEDKTD